MRRTVPLVPVAQATRELGVAVPRRLAVVPLVWAIHAAWAAAVWAPDVATMKIMEVGIREAKTRLSQLVKAALAGEEVFLTNRGEKTVQLTVVKPTGGLRGLGIWKGKVNLYEGWDSPEEDKKIEDMFEFLQEEG